MQEVRKCRKRKCFTKIDHENYFSSEVSRSTKAGITKGRVRVDLTLYCYIRLVEILVVVDFKTYLIEQIQQ